MSGRGEGERREGYDWRGLLQGGNCTGEEKGFCFERGRGKDARRKEEKGGAVSFVQK